MKHNNGIICITSFHIWNLRTSSKSPFIPASSFQCPSYSYSCTCGLNVDPLWILIDSCTSFPPFLSHGDWQLYPGAHERDISIFRQMWREAEPEKDMFKRLERGTVSSSCAKIPCYTPPTNIHTWASFLHCYDKCVCIMKVGVKWPHSDPCVALVSCLFEFRLFLSSLSPCRARRCVPQHLCVCDEWNWDIFFLALLSLLSARGSIQHYTKWWLETHGFILSLNTFAFDQAGLGPLSDWCLYHLLFSRCASLRCQTRVCLGKFGQRRISLWCVLFHAMFVYLSEYTQARSVFNWRFIVFLQGYRHAYAIVTHIIWV